jgi:type III secretion system YscD/HrpQ family protein
MVAYLIADEGPLAGMTIRLEEGEEWTIGRDPDVNTDVIEDPMVSRQHLSITKSDEGYVIENLSSVNTATIDGLPISKPTLLQEGDRVAIGSVVFLFTHEAPTQEGVESDTENDAIEVELEPIELETDDFFSFAGDQDSPWRLLITSGAARGTEFGIDPDNGAVIGKDPAESDIVLPDMSVSKRHAEVSCMSNGSLFIQDLGSRNGTYVEGKQIEGQFPLSSRDEVVIGETSLLVISREEARETLTSTFTPKPKRVEVEEEEVVARAEARDWKEMVIPYRHIAFGGLIAMVALFGFMATATLFRAVPIEYESGRVEKYLTRILAPYPAVEFSYNERGGTLFLLGHVMTRTDHNELSYMLSTIPQIASVEDNIVVDEEVWQSFNPLIGRNPNWRGVTLTSTEPGSFSLRGYVDKQEELGNLDDFITLNFPYLDRLSRDVVVETTLNTQIQSMVIAEGFSAVQFSLTNGDVVFTGRVAKGREGEFTRLVTAVRRLEGVREVQNFVVFAGAMNARVDISSRYPVVGTAKIDGKPMFVMVAGRLFTQGDLLDGLTIEKIGSGVVYLEKDGIKYQINYNPH